MVRLLSLCVATLMALFKDNEFASRVSTPELTILIQEAGTALLDDKLSSTDVLSEETGTQLVRAINKVITPFVRSVVPFSNQGFPAGCSSLDEVPTSRIFHCPTCSTEAAVARNARTARI